MARNENYVIGVGYGASAEAAAPTSKTRAGLKWQQRLLRRHRLARAVFSFPELTKVLLAPAFAVAALPSESSPEERSASGVIKGLPV